MLNFLLMILAFGLMITIHETGHFLVARAFGVGIEKFSIGFGRAIAEFERKGIKYRIAWIPLGGYVKMMGENPDDDEDEKGLSDELSFQKKAWWKKALIAFSGPFANLLLGLLLFIFAFMLPQKQEDQRPLIQKVEGTWTEVFSPADSIIAVNGKNVKGFNEFLLALKNTQANTVLISREGQQLSVEVPKGELDSLYKSISPAVSSTIGEVFTGMPAWRGGLKQGDTVLAVDSVAVSDWYAMRDRIIGSPNKEVVLTINRDGKVITRLIALEKNVAMGEQKMIGISQSMPVKSVERYSPKEAVVYGSRSTVNFIVMNYMGLYKLFKQPGELKNNLGGPVMMATISQQVGARGFSYLILFFGSISLILMIMNLLPIPVLDGGHIMFAFVEGIIRRPIPLRIQGFLQRIGLALLLLLMIFAFYSDISKVLLRVFALRQ
jgi:regulator of sigma E protease